jgi:hypothetical protein
MISDTEIMLARSDACVAMESLRGRWHEMSDDWRAFTGGWCLAYSLKLDKALARHSVKLEDDPELERLMSKPFARTQ